MDVVLLKFVQELTLTKKITTNICCFISRLHSQESMGLWQACRLFDIQSHEKFLDLWCNLIRWMIEEFFPDYFNYKLWKFKHQIFSLDYLSIQCYTAGYEDESSSFMVFLIFCFVFDSLKYGFCWRYNLVLKYDLEIS